MKSIEIKTLLTILVLLISNSLCVNNNLRREFNFEGLNSDLSYSSDSSMKLSSDNSMKLSSDSSMKLSSDSSMGLSTSSSSNVTNIVEEDIIASSVKNNWETGFILPNFEVKNQNEKEFYKYGKVSMYPKNMETARKTKVDPKNISYDNQVGFIIEFPQQDLTNIKQIAFLSYLGGERFLIPWRFFEKKPEYKNPWGMKNKFLSANLIDDKGNKYTIKLLLPWKALGWYISDKQAKDICTLCEEMSQNQNLMIKNYKTEINKIYSKIEANYSSKQTISNLKRLIQENKDKIKANEESVKDMNDKINVIEETVSPLLIDRENLKNKNEDLSDSINILAKKIDDIKNKDPNLATRAMTEMRNSRNRLSESFDLLSRIATDKKDDINKAKDASFTFNEKDMQKELNKVGALKLQFPA